MFQFRLKQCGIPNCIYLVERQGERHYSLPLTTLLQASTNTQVVDNFVVKFTAGHRESVVYLSSLSTMFTNIFTVSEDISKLWQKFFFSFSTSDFIKN